MNATDAYLVSRCLLLAADLERLGKLSPEERHGTLVAVVALPDQLAEAVTEGRSQETAPA